MPRPTPPRGSPDRIGRVQLQIRQAFIASGGAPLRMRDLLPRCYPRADRYKDWHRWNVRRAALTVAIQIGRDGKGVIWAPSASLAM